MGIPVSRPTLGNEEVQAVQEVFATGWLGLGDRVKKFEQEAAAFVGVKHLIGVNTGTSALHLALAAAGVGPGDEVLMPSITFVACPQAAVMAGARPVFCEVEEDGMTLSIEDVERRLTPRSKAVMPVHYTGQACDMDPLLDLAARKGLTVVEDAAHAFGSSYKGRKIGSFGHMTCFSFDPIKVLTCGEGGAVATNREDWAGTVEKLRMLGIEGDSWSRYQHRRRWHYDVPSPGFRYHMTNIGAAMGLEQLKKLGGFIERRRRIVRAYDAAFAGLPGARVLRHDVDAMAPFTYVLRVTDGRRDALMEFLRGKGVDTGVHYIPNHLHSFFKDGAGALPVSERLFQEIVTLPLYSHMTDEEVRLVTDGAAEFLKTKTAGAGRA